jgi:hypothetical protein
MAYVAPSTKTTGVVVTAADWNQDIVANMLALKDPPSVVCTLDDAADYTTTSTSWVDISSTGLTATVVSTGGIVMVHLHGLVNVDNAANYGTLELDVSVDGTNDAGDDGIICLPAMNLPCPISFTHIITVSAGSHIYRPRWRVAASSGTTTALLYAGAGTSRKDIHSQFWAREVS